MLWDRTAVYVARSLNYLVISIDHPWIDYGSLKVLLNLQETR